MSHVTCEWVIWHVHESCHVCMSHVAMNESYHVWMWMSYMHDWYHMWMSHVLYEWVTSQWVMSYINESCHISSTWDMNHAYHLSFKYVTWLIHVCAMTHWYMWHDSFICVPRHPHEIWTMHVWHVNVSVTHAWFVSGGDESCLVWTSHVSYEWVKSHMNEACLIWMSHVTLHICMIHITCGWVVLRILASSSIYGWVMSCMNESCHIAYMHNSSHVDESCHVYLHQVQGGVESQDALSL